MRFVRLTRPSPSPYSQRVVFFDLRSLVKLVDRVQDYDGASTSEKKKILAQGEKAINEERMKLRKRPQASSDNFQDGSRHGQGQPAGRSLAIALELELPLARERSFNCE